MDSPHVHIPYDRINNFASLIKDKTLNLEIYFSADILENINIKSVEQLIHSLEYFPSLSIHAPFMDLSPAAVDSRIREVTMFRFNQIMDIAAAVRPRTIVFHSGFDKWKYALDVDIWLEKSLITWQEILERAVKIETMIAIENIFEDTPGNLRLLAEKMDSQYFGLCFDTGHFNLFSKVSLDTWINDTGKYISELHLHDNDGTKDAHAAPGTGTFDFNRLFELLKDRDGILRTIEAHSPEEVTESLSVLESFHVPPKR
ncbi:endonuclease IV [bacterium BMS3Abin07]|nr:endonuclease IV [bacterium BMS3Abin07]